MARMHKKVKHEEHENHERYLVTYADMITLLLVFFIVLFSISNADKEKFIRLASGLHDAFNVDVLSTENQGAGGPASMETDPRFSTYLSIRGQVARITSRMQLTNEDASVELTSEGIVIHLSEAVLFPPGDATLRPDGLRVLDALATVIGPLPNQVRVEGHTDNVTPTGGEISDNWTLSVLRSVAVVEYLTDVHSIVPERLAAAGYGQYRPIGDNETVEGRRLNRRVDFMIIEREIMDFSTFNPGVVSEP